MNEASPRDFLVLVLAVFFLLEEMIEHCEDSNIIPASPTSNKSMKLGTPVIKLKKLTQDEILQYSPSHKESKGEISSSTSTQKKRLGRPCKNSNKDRILQLLAL
jgi:hypothetical protein